MKPIILFLAAMLAVSCNAEAQLEEKPVPKAPYLTPVPLKAHWTITLRHPGHTGESAKAGGAEPVASSFPVSIDVVKSAKVKQTTLSFPDGTTRRFDQVDPYLLVSSPAGVSLSILDNNTPPYPLYSDGFLFTNCVKLANYKDVATYKGIVCFHYQSNSGEAWVAVDSMLPVLAKEASGIIAEYQFKAPPESDLTLPPEEAAVLEKQQKALKIFRELR